MQLGLSLYAYTFFLFKQWQFRHQTDLHCDFKMYQEYFFYRLPIINCFSCMSPQTLQIDILVYNILVFYVCINLLLILCSSNRDVHKSRPPEIPYNDLNITPNKRFQGDMIRM